MGSKAHKPLAMSRDSMLAILAVPTRKTQTRRVIVPQPEEMKPLGKHGQQWPYRRGADVKDMPGVPLWEAMRPRYQPGDAVYFKEPLKRTFTRSCEPGPRTYIVYALDLLLVGNRMRQAWPWKNAVLSGRFMPKRLSRACAVVSEVRVERVQDISEEDAIAEGAEKMALDDLGQSWQTYRRGYQAWWDSLNAKRGFGWDTNPWIWVYSWTDLVVGWQETQELIGKEAK